MTLSLSIVLLMCLVVLPALLWAFFCSFTNANQIQMVEISNNSIKGQTPKFKFKTQRQPLNSDDAIAMTDFNSMLSLPVSSDYYSKVIEIIKIYPLHQTFFRGYDLWQVIQNAGFIYQDDGLQKRFFHYFNDAKTKVLFSLVPMSKPFEFIFSEMGQFKTEGLMLLLFDENGRECMHDIAQHLAEELEGRCDFESQTATPSIA